MSLRTGEDKSRCSEKELNIRIVNRIESWEEEDLVRDIRKLVQSVRYCAVYINKINFEIVPIES